MQKVIILFLIGFAFVFTAETFNTQRDDTEIVIVRAPLITQTNSYQTEYEQMLYPCVRITAGYSTGSGVIINHKAHKDHKENTKKYIYILSAAHVVGNESEVDIEFYPEVSTSCLRASVVITDTSKDLALLCALCDLCGESIYSASLAPENYQAYLFTPVWAVGCSLGLNPRPSAGHITAINNDTWEISAPILPGNSGGPVFDGRTYEVIGIAVWVKVCQGQLVTTMAGIVPINEIYEFLDSATKTQRH